MTLDTILVPAVNEESFKATLEQALPHAKAFSSHLMAFHVTEHSPVAHVAEIYWQEEVMKSHQAAVRAQSEKLESQFYDFCRDQSVDAIPCGALGKRDNVSASWSSLDGRHYATMALAARQTDLICLSVVEADPKPYWQSVLFEELVTIAGVPILLLPASTPSGVPQSILIAWNGSVEARRAIAFAEPFLAKAKTVRIISIGAHGKDKPSAQDMALYLKRKGIEATGQDLPDVKAPVEDQIALAADDMSADLLVMGAYSRPRWQEMVWGGVTRSVLEKPDLPVLLSH